MDSHRLERICEYASYVGVTAAICTAVVLVIGSIASCNADETSQRQQTERAKVEAITKQVQAGADPVEARCAVDNRINEPVCITQRQKGR